MLRILKFVTIFFISFYPSKLLAQGHQVSKMTDKAIAPHGCQETSRTKHHSNGSSSTRTTIICTKEVKRDKNGKIVKEDDTKAGSFKSGKDSFFGKN